MHFKLLPCFIQLKAFVVKLILNLSCLLMDIYTPLFIVFHWYSTVSVFIHNH